ncbi:hypothetical protein NM208_g14760 [Fusarium decemcellulare]|uniref:Uncharacterized protein n=1 Tax=Fusarium decemcellulare TaxID=57161 RepID=A0ACC1RGU2_9HYPO|nr:hypothetical protein NM208_g14760 [Fusarium decemcellulare]
MLPVILYGSRPDRVEVRAGTTERTQASSIRRVNAHGHMGFAAPDKHQARQALATREGAQSRCYRDGGQSHSQIVPPTGLPVVHLPGKGARRCKSLGSFKRQSLLVLEIHRLVRPETLRQDDPSRLESQ